MRLASLFESFLDIRPAARGDRFALVRRADRVNERSTLASLATLGEAEILAATISPAKWDSQGWSIMLESPSGTLREFTAADFPGDAEDYGLATPGTLSALASLAREV